MSLHMPSAPAPLEKATPLMLRAAGLRLRRMLSGAALSIAAAGTAAGYTVTLTPAAPLTVYLQVGVGSFTGDYLNGGQPQKNTTINTVSASLTSAVVGNGTAQAMTTNSTASESFWDGYAFCNAPGQLYIGGFYRTTGSTTAAAQVTATVPTALINAGGATIPFSQIRWSTSGNGDSGSEPFPAGTFISGGVQSVGSMASNTWNESCWTFSYSNSSVPAAGTFTGVVLYTLSAP
jgi:hypothetical protein